MAKSVCRINRKFLQQKKILLVNPSPREVVLDFLPKNLPLALLSLASTLVDRYDTVLHDRAVNKDDHALEALLTDPGVICVGISVLTGPCIFDAIHCSIMVRQQRPDIPIVWGGWHATKVPETILCQSYVDFVVQGEGEVAFSDLVSKLEQAGSDISILGVGCKNSDKISLIPPAPPLDLDKLPPLPFQLIENVEPYIIYNWVPGGERCLPLETSRGCPLACSFCEVSSYFAKNYSFRSPERIVEEIVNIKKRFGIGGVRFFDPNFFFRIKRAKAFAELLIKEKIDIKWAADGTIVQFKNISTEDLRLFYRSGLRYVSFGVESGSERVRYQVLNKGFTNEQCKHVIHKFRDVGIQFKFNVMLGLPGETIAESIKTVDFALEIISSFANSSIGGHMYLYMPLPGTPLSDAADSGYQPPKSLEGYAKIDYSSGDSLPWLPTKHRGMLESISAMSYFLSAPAKDIPLTGVKKILFKVLRRFYLFRLRKHWFVRTPDILLLKRVLH